VLYEISLVSAIRGASGVEAAILSFSEAFDVPARLLLSQEMMLYDGC